MGGETRVCARLDGKIYSKILHTSSLAAFVQSPKIPARDRSHVEEFLESSDDKLVAPWGYGLTFVDHMTRKIYDAQGYTCVLTISAVAIFLSSAGCIRADEHIRFQRLFEAGFIVTAVDMRSREPISLKNKTFRSVMKLVKARDRDLDFVIDYGYEYHQFEDTPEGFLEMHKLMANNGIVFSESDTQGWRDHYEVDGWREWYEEGAEIPQHIIDFYNKGVSL